MAEDLPPEVMLPRLSRALSVCETQLAHELWSEEVKQPSKLQRIRSRGTDLLHSQGVLLAVVILNCVDCILVLSELMLDVYFVKDMIVTAEHTMKTFNRKLQERYPAQFFGLLLHDTHEFYNRVLRAHLMWNTTDKGAMEGSKSVPEAFYSVGGNNSLVVGLDSGAGPVFFYDADDPEFLEDVTLSAEEIVSHALHKTSIAILATLVIYTVLKVFCYGLSFVKHKMEVFDGIVVVASFTLDVCYIKGLTNYPVESFILILTIMVPWRVIRVLNS
ncbi:HVCN1-like protein, partial [Mya arenaria]